MPHPQLGIRPQIVHAVADQPLEPAASRNWNGCGFRRQRRVGGRERQSAASAACGTKRRPRQAAGWQAARAAPHLSYPSRASTIWPHPSACSAPSSTLTHCLRSSTASSADMSSRTAKFTPPHAACSGPSPGVLPLLCGFLRDNHLGMRDALWWSPPPPHLPSKSEVGSGCGARVAIAMPVVQPRRASHAARIQDHMWRINVYRGSGRTHSCEGWSCRSRLARRSRDVSIPLAGA